MNTYIVSVVVAALVIIIAAVVSNSIAYEGGAHPKDPGKRKLWFWVLSILSPILTYVLGAFVVAPDKNLDPMGYDEHMNSLPIAAIVALVIYVVIGFILSKAFKNGKLGHWF